MLFIYANHSVLLLLNSHFRFRDKLTLNRMVCRFCNAL